MCCIDASFTFKVIPVLNMRRNLIRKFEKELCVQSKLSTAIAIEISYNQVVLALQGYFLR
jgi:hypothetical protein